MLLIHVSLQLNFPTALTLVVKKVKKSPNRPGVAQRLFKLLNFHDIRHVKAVRLSASRTSQLYP